MESTLTRSLSLSWRNVAVDLGGQRILRSASIDVAAGEWLALLGPNGAGKTTLLRTLMDDVNYSGSVSIGDTDLVDLAARDRAQQLAVVPQHPVIPPGFLVFDYALLGRTPHQGMRFAPSQSDRIATRDVLRRLDIDHFAARPLDTLSGGERQRVVIARALVQDTPVLVLDEPTAFLDAGHQLDLLELIDELRVERGLTIVSSLHDLTVAGQFADRVAVLADGQVVAHGTPHDVLTAELLTKYWRVNADVTVAQDGSVSISILRWAGRRPPFDPQHQD